MTNPTNSTNPSLFSIPSDMEFDIADIKTLPNRC